MWEHIARGDRSITTRPVSPYSLWARMWRLVGVIVSGRSAYTPDTQCEDADLIRMAVLRACLNEYGL